jgi:hypothetical protein
MIFAPFGDSHCLFLAGASASNPVSQYPHDTPTAYWLGPAKIWGLEHASVNHTQEKFNALKLAFSNSHDTIPIACLGEIDIRVNVGRQCLKAGSLAPIAELASLYLQQLNAIDAPMVVIWGPPPTNYNSEDLNYPCYMDCRSRNAITHIFNRCLLSQINNYPKLKFATIFYDLINERFESTGGLADNIHLDLNLSDTARKIIQSVVNVETKAVLNFQKFNAMPPVDFALTTATGNSFSKQMYLLAMEPPVSAFLHRKPRSRNISARCIELRDLTADPSEAFALKQFNDTPLLNFHDFCSLYFDGSSQENAVELADFIHDIEKNSMNLFNDEGYADSDSFNTLLALKTRIFSKYPSLQP